MCNKHTLKTIALLTAAIWLILSLWLLLHTLFIDPDLISDDHPVSYLQQTQILHSVPEYIPDVSSIVHYDYNNIPSSMHTIPSLFIISAPKCGSSSLIKWLVSTQQIFGDYALAAHRVENNMLANYYVDAIITRNDTIGFYLSDEDIMKFNDWRYVSSFTEKPPKHKTMFLSWRKSQRQWSKKFKSQKEGNYTKVNAMSTMKRKSSIRHKKPSGFTQRKRFKYFGGRKLLRFSNRRVYKRRGSGRKRGKGQIYKPLYNAARDKKYVNRDEYVEKISSAQSYYTVGKSVFYFHLPYMARIFAIKYPNTKILIALRDPVPRLKSNYLFFIGTEIEKLSQEYGNVNLFLKHIMNHKWLKPPVDKMRNMVSELNEAEDVNVTQWHEIFKVYRVFLVNMVRVCKHEFALMGFTKYHIENSCKENDLIRSAFGTSCYIIPIMYWYMINLNAKRNFRLLQSETMFTEPDEHITKVLCWVYTDKGSYAYDTECDEWRHETQWKTNKQWRKSEAKDDTMDVEITTELKNKITQELLPCNIALQNFVQTHPMLLLSPFDFTLWH